MEWIAALAVLVAVFVFVLAVAVSTTWTGAVYQGAVPPGYILIIKEHTVPIVAGDCWEGTVDVCFELQTKEPVHRNLPSFLPPELTMRSMLFYVFNLQAARYEFDALDSEDFIKTVMREWGNHHIGGYTTIANMSVSNLAKIKQIPQLPQCKIHPYRNLAKINQRPYR